MIITEKTTGHMKRNINDIDKGRKEYLKGALKNKSGLKKEMENIELMRAQNEARNFYMELNFARKSFKPKQPAKMR